MADAGTKETKAFTPDMWAGALDDLNAGNQLSDVQYLKEGKTRIRLLPEAATGPDKLYAPVTRYWQGKPRTKYVMKCVIWRKNEQGVEEANIRVLIVPKTVLKDVLALLTEGYDLFEPKSGTGITITTTGSGLKKSYSVVPSPKPVELPNDLADLDMSLTDYAKLIEERDANRAEDNGGGNRRESASADDGEDQDW